MDTVFEDFKATYNGGRGYDLSMTISPLDPPSNPNRLHSFFTSTNFQNARKDFQYRILYDNSYIPFGMSTDEGEGWVDVYYAYWKAVGEILKTEAAEKNNAKPSWSKVYEAWKEMTTALIRGYTNCGFPAWTVPCLYVAGKYMRIFAIKADDSAGTNGSVNALQDDLNPEGEKNEKLEDAARHLNRIFNICLSDRAPLEESRKWAIYNIINLLFKTYFKLNSISLSKNILKAIQAYRGDMPSLEAFPLSHQVTFKYYVGVIYFLEEDYTQHGDYVTRTQHAIKTVSLLSPYPRLQSLFLPLSRCIKKGDLSGFDAALLAGEDEFVKRRIYLTLERGRDIALRNLLRKVFIAGGFEEAKDAKSALVRKTRVPVTEFGAAISLGSRERMENDEVECLIANMIYKNLMKGYIARDRGIVVLSINNALVALEVPCLVERLRAYFSSVDPTEHCLTRRTGWTLTWDMKRSLVEVQEGERGGHEQSKWASCRQICKLLLLLKA
ncbi:hypothetical protein B7494_g5290 [Chlorociboria aeruginascens]|nr:hypothetical protein B7494_g5290 [Chlorociboria aeruginascens]